MEKEVSCRISNSIIKYFKSKGYDTNSLLEGLSCSKTYLEDSSNWITAEIRDELSKRADKISDNEKIMYRIALETPDLKLSDDTEKIIKQFGNPILTYANLPRLFSNFDRTFRIEIDLAKDNFAIIRKIPKRNFFSSILSCDYFQGILSAIPVFWNLPQAKVQEYKCGCKESKSQFEIKKAKPECRFEVGWQTGDAKTKFSIKNALFNTPLKIENTQKKLKSSLELLDQKNAELTQRNLCLTKVREISAGIDSAKSVDDVFKLIVDLAMGIPQISFILVHKADSSTGYLTTPYFSKFRESEIIPALKASRIDVLDKLGTQLLSEKLNFPLINLPVINEYLEDRKTLVFDRLSQVLHGSWDSETCDKVQEIINFNKIVIIPLKMDYKYCGSLVFYLKDELALDILEMIGTHCCIALKNVLTMQNLERRNQELLAINAIATQTLVETNMQQIIEKTVAEISLLLKADTTSVSLINENGTSLELISQIGMPEELIPYLKILSVDSLYGKLISSQKTFLTGNMNDYFKDFPEFLHEKYFNANVNYISVPLFTENHPNGIITAIRQHSHIFNEDEITLFKSLSHQLSIAIENSRLHQNLINRIDELELTRKSLADSEEKMRLTLESASEAIIVTSANGKIRQANNVAIYLQGYVNDISYLGTNALKYVDLKDRSRIIRHIKEIGISGSVKDTEITLIKKTGEKYPAECSISLYKGSQGGLEGFVICVRDISQRKKVEAQLRESESKYRLIAENTHDYIAMSTLDGMCVYASPSHKQLGYKWLDLVGKQLIDLVHPDDKNIILQIIREFKTSKDKQLEHIKKNIEDNFVNFRVKDRSGEWHDMETSVNFVETTEGSEFKLLTIARDITTRKQAEEEMQIIYQNEKAIRFALEKEINTRAEFFRALVHELKTPLTPIVVSSETLRDLIQDKMFKKLAENVYQGAIRLNSRVDELLDISRGELGMLKLDSQPMDIGILIKDVANYVKVQISGNLQILKVDIPEQLPQIIADEMRLRQVLLNLLNNAMKFTPAGGQIQIKARSDDKYLVVEVNDTGRGIDESELARLFEPYNRIEEDRQHFSGLGLGLALSKQLIDLHGGQIEVVSKKGIGSTFRFTLPINKKISSIC